MFNGVSNERSSSTVGVAGIDIAMFLSLFLNGKGLLLETFSWVW